MIKLVNFFLEDYITVSISEAKREIENILLDKPEYDYHIAYDSEGSGFYPSNGYLSFAQLGFSEVQFIILPENLIEFASLLQRCTVIIHNAKHDLKFLYDLGIKPKQIKDTFLQELIIQCGKNPLKLAYKQAGLAYLLQKHFEVRLDKEKRKSIKLDKASIDYGAKDIIYLHKLNELQEKTIKEHRLNKAVELDNNFVKVLSYTENAGFAFDQEGWLANYTANSNKQKAIYDELFKLIKNDSRTEHYIVTVSDLFSDPKEVLDINFDSPKDALEFFQALGVNLEHKGKITTDAKVLKKSNEPIVKKFIAYKKITKSVNTYGLSFIEDANLHTDKRIRTNFKQIITTGRMSSGGDDTIDLSGINFQNIPKKSIERKYFVSAPGYLLGISDFTGQETRILAELSKDKDYFDFIVNPEKDLHCFMLQCLYPEKYKHLDHNTISKNFGKERSWVKPATFCIPYGGNEMTIADNLSIDMEIATQGYNTFMRTFPDLVKYFNRQEHFALSTGFIEYNCFTKRKIFLPKFDEYKKLAKDKNLSKEDYRLKMQYENKVKRFARNYPCQGLGSEMTKLAGIYFYNWILKNKYFNIVKIIAFIHDEIVIEAPEFLINHALEYLNKSMIKAGKIICPSVPILTSSRISKQWLEE